MYYHNSLDCSESLEVEDRMMYKLAEEGADFW